METKPKSRQRHWSRFSLRMLFLLVTVASLTLAYVGSYYQLSRRGMQEAKNSGAHVFFYVPLDEAMREDYTELYRKHFRLMAFYAPLNWLDHELFGALHPIRAGIRKVVP